ncbi:LacI family DNA-binding transcriptional regulator [Hafnia paralvei]|uniref:LacI family DNA-binding transcriptional regulator n=1 Tax=Hafnia paralvei TaxID=546367 RepID=UPI001CCF0F6A|nr:LacI family DNA-binding transcriptional regulator [Hafnia paralvei]UBM41659.1 LacI family DNA-binding transcriptional regulator [Hafnia paralvei]
MITMLDVSLRAGVSKATVSRVLNGTGQVKESTRIAVFKAVEELGYRPNLLAQALANQTSNTIGLVVSNFGRLLRQAAHLIEASGKHMIVTDGHDTPEGEREAVHLLIDRRCDAIILYTRFMEEPALMQLISQHHALMVINRDLPQARDRCVFFEQQQAASEVVKYLITQGHRQIACITAPINTPTAQSRLAGYKDALEQNQITYHDSLVTLGDSSVAGGYHACCELLARQQPFTALFACNDDMAIGALRALHQAGKRVPEDVSLFGFDDEPSAEYLQPSLSTVYLPIDKMISTAITQALRLSSGEIVEPVEPFVGELKVRESVAKIK